MARFDGWKVAGALCSVYFLCVGVVFYGFAVVLPSMILDMGWSRGDASVGYALLSVMIGISAPLAAVFVKRIGARNTMIVGGVLSATGAVITYFTQSLLQYYIGVGVVLGVGMTLQSFVPSAQILTNWFARRRAMVMGLFLATGGLGAFVAAPGFAYLNALTGDWRSSWLVMAACALAGALITYFFVHNHPDDLGQHQDGVDKSVQTTIAEKKSSAVYQTAVEWTARDALSSSAFWTIMFASILITMGLAINTSQSVIYLQHDRGIDPIVAGSALGSFGLLNAIGRLIGGAIGDYIEPRLIMACGLALEMIGIVLLNYTDTAAMIYVYVTIFGFGYGLGYVSLPAIIANYYGPHDYAKILGYCHLIIVPMGAVASVAAGYAYDVLNSYTMIFFGFAAIATLPVGMMLMMRPPGRV